MDIHIYILSFASNPMRIRESLKLIQRSQLKNLCNKYSTFVVFMDSPHLHCFWRPSISVEPSLPTLQPGPDVRLVLQNVEFGERRVSTCPRPHCSASLWWVRASIQRFSSKEGKMTHLPEENHQSTKGSWRLDIGSYIKGTSFCVWGIPVIMDGWTHLFWVFLNESLWVSLWLTLVPDDEGFWGRKRNLVILRYSAILADLKWCIFYR